MNHSENTNDRFWIAVKTDKELTYRNFISELIYQCHVVPNEVISDRNKYQLTINIMPDKDKDFGAMVDIYVWEEGMHGDRAGCVGVDNILGRLKKSFPDVLMYKRVHMFNIDKQ